MSEAHILPTQGPALRSYTPHTQVLIMLARLRNLSNHFIRNPMTSAPRDRNSTGDLSGPNAMRHSEYERHKEAGTLPAGTTPPVAPALVGWGYQAAFASL